MQVTAHKGHDEVDIKRVWVVLMGRCRRRGDIRIEQAHHIGVLVPQSDHNVHLSDEPLGFHMHLVGRYVLHRDIRVRLPVESHFDDAKATYADLLDRLVPGSPSRSRRNGGHPLKNKQNNGCKEIGSCQRRGQQELMETDFLFVLFANECTSFGEDEEEKKNFGRTNGVPHWCRITSVSIECSAPRSSWRTVQQASSKMKSVAELPLRIHWPAENVMSFGSPQPATRQLA